MNSKIVQKAVELASDKILMDSYKDFYNGKGYFFTKNRLLDGASIKPVDFPGKRNFKSYIKEKFTEGQKAYLAAKSGVNLAFIEEWDYDALAKVYNDWNSNYYSVFYGPKARWACNLFVGEAIYMAQITCLNSENKYYSAKQIWNGEGRFKLVKKKDVGPGCIAAFGGHHLEIVTKVTRNQTFCDDEFCSRGAGRGPSDFGTERCESNLNPFGTSREINDENIRFLTI